MNMQTYIEELRSRVLTCHATRDQIAAATHGVVSSSWVSKFAAGRMRNPRADSLVALDTALASLSETPALKTAA